MTLLRLQNEANCLTVQHTEQSREPQPLSDLETKLPLPRERFSASTRSRRSSRSALHFSGVTRGAPWQ